MVNIKINNINLSVPKDFTILEAAEQANIKIPTLCYLKNINNIGACRICVVEIKNKTNLVAACTYPVEENLEIFTNTHNVRESRKMTLELILSNHDKKCLSCFQNNNCYLQKLCTEYNVNQDKFKEKKSQGQNIDLKSPYLVRDNNKCILCRRCVSVCDKIQTVNAISMIGRGFNTHVGSAFEKSLNDTCCIGCGQCINVCPVGALYEKTSVNQVWNAIENSEKNVIFFTAPSIRVSLGEKFNLSVGDNIEEKMVSAIKLLGVDKVFNMDIAADLTIIEEANEFIKRFSENKNLPIITSCSPGWVKFCEYFYPEILPNLSTCKSPQQMFGAILKTFYAQKNNIDPKTIFTVSIVPCTSKKFEISRENMNSYENIQDVDAVLTTNELARMIKTAGIDMLKINGQDFDAPFSKSSSAGSLFASSGGVMEAALRTASDTLNDKSNQTFHNVRTDNNQFVKEFQYLIADKKINVAIVSGLSNVHQILDNIINRKKTYHFIEIMACAGGCLNGGGQPRYNSNVYPNKKIIQARANAIYNIDSISKLKKSNDNLTIKMLYDEFLGVPGKGNAHKYLHTQYKVRDLYN